MFNRILWTLTAVAGLIVAGCDSPQRVTVDARYETLPRGQQRDAARAERLNDQAVDAIDAGELDRAEQLLKDALTADVTFGPAHNNLGSVYLEQQRYYLAAWEFEYAIRLMPASPEPKNNLGLVFEAVGKTDAAIEQFNAAAQLAPDDPVYLGNEARARLRAGQRGPEVRHLLQDVVMKDERPEWRQWARERLAIMPTNNNAGPTDD